MAPKGWSKLGKQPLPQGDKIQMLGVISPGDSYWPGTKPDASFFPPSLSRTLFMYALEWFWGEHSHPKNTCPASSWTFSTDQLLVFSDLQPFPSRGEEYGGKYKTDRKKIPVLSSICASPRTGQSGEGSLGPVDQSIMASTLESHLLSQVSAKPLQSSAFHNIFQLCVKSNFVFVWLLVAGKGWFSCLLFIFTVVICWSNVSMFIAQSAKTFFCILQVTLN